MKNDKTQIVNTLKQQGDTSFKQRDFNSAISYYKKIIYRKKDDFSAYIRLGMCFERCKDYSKALRYFKKALKIMPDYFEAHRLIGFIYEKKGKTKKAVEHYTKYTEHAAPSEILANIYNTLGYLYSSINEYKKLDLQIEYFEKSLELKPNNPHVLRNLAFSHYKKEDYKKTAEYLSKFFNQGVDDDVDAYLLYSAAQIYLGNFKEAWKYYEYRFIPSNKFIPYPKIRQPKWNGEDLSDKTILVHWEQGFGDTLIFFRLLHLLKPQAKKIIFRVQDELAKLLKLNIEGVEVVTTSDSIVNLYFDYHVPLISLMHLLNIQPDKIPLTEGYIKADEKRVLEYKKKFFDNDCFKIGIAWSGRKSGEQERNIPLECFYPLTKLKNVKVYSFQKSAGSEQLENLPQEVEITDLGKTFKDFSDSAAAMENVDLFISSDNGVLNLAGAMGKTAFLLLSGHPNWRWFFDNDKTPWYKSVKTFKKQNKSWNNLIKKVISEIKTELYFKFF